MKNDTATGPSAAVTLAALLLAVALTAVSATAWAQDDGAAADADQPAPAEATANTQRDADPAIIADASADSADAPDDGPPVIGGEVIGTAREAISLLHKTERTISKERKEWGIGREVLQERIKLLEQEIGSLQEKIDEAQETIGDAEKKTEQLSAENDRLREASKSLESEVVVFETRVKALLARLPDPIRDRVKPLSQSLPKDVDPNADPDDPAAKGTELSLGDRFQNVIGILNEVNKFNREITMTSEVRKLDGGASAEVTTVYVGIGQAFYASGNGKVAGAGVPSDSGWEWTSLPGAADEILTVISILKNEEVASFVRLPITIK